MTCQEIDVAEFTVVYPVIRIHSSVIVLEFSAKPTTRDPIPNFLSAGTAHSDDTGMALDNPI